MSMPVAVIGAGSFGTCLAILCARDNEVRIWSRRPELAEAINLDHRNPQYLREQRLPDSVRATSDLAEALDGCELVICAVPSHGLRDVMARAGPHLSDEAILVSAVKGIEYESGMTMHQVENVFDRFYRAETESAEISGLGLGMSIVKQIIVDHGGEVCVDSAPGEGTKVTFSLPIKERTSSF